MTEAPALTVEDRLELQELIARYSLARDDKRFDDLLDFFAEDGEFERIGKVVSGRDAVRAFFLASADRYEFTNHVTHSQVLDVQPSPPGRPHVKGVVSGHAELLLNGEIHFAAYRYYDDYVKDDGRWLFRRRSLNFFYSMRPEDTVDGFRSLKRIRWADGAPTEADLPMRIPGWPG
ncbi:nuclear transport factor 2 family protein [Microbacterium sp. NPDC055910]|uniref:nuclear transport factor 2 family protein n=1 Tax=Microbacterium sp. NPDC055910 TaxID=3345659 RepID=UPI0035D70176